MSVGIIETVEQFLDALDAAESDDAREALYEAAALGELTAVTLVGPAKGRTCDQWLLMRASAGPPGVALPSWVEARTRALMDLHAGSAADAYQLLMAGPPLRREAVIHALQLAMLLATKREGGGYLTVRVAKAWGVAMLAVGRGASARALYEGFRFHEMEAKPAVFEILDALHDAPDLLDHPALVRFAQRWWRRLSFPTTPDLPPPRPRRGDPPTVEELFESLRTAGLERVAEAIAKGPKRYGASDADFIERCWAAAREGARSVEVGVDVTEEIKEWLKGAMLDRNVKVAAVAARSLYHAGQIDAPHAAAAVLFDLRAADLPILLEGLRDKDERPPQALLDAAQVCERLTGDAADAALWLLMPSQLANERARFHESIQHLEAIAEAADGAPAHVQELIEILRASRSSSPEGLAMDARVRRWFDAIRTHLAGLRSDQALDLPAFDVAAARFARPLRADAALRQRALPALNDHPPAVRFVAAGALLQVEDDPEDAQLLRFQIAREIGQVNLPGLIPLRVRLLEEMLEGQAVRDVEIAEVLLLLGRSYARLSRLADGVAIFEAALREARARRDDNLIAECICEWVTAQVGYARQLGIHEHDTDEWLELLGEARELSTTAIQQAFIEIAILGTLHEGRNQKDAKAVRAAMTSSLKALYSGMDADDRVRISADIATAINQDFESEEAVEWIHQALDELSIDEHPWAPAPLLCELGLAYARLHLSSHAMLSFERASMAASEFGDDLQIAKIEALNENYASRVGGAKPQRLQFIRRARHACERLGHHQEVVHHGLREARCAYEGWQAAPALRAVSAHLPLIRDNAQFDDYSKQYRSLLDHFDFSDSPAPISPPDYSPPAPAEFARAKLDEVIEGSLSSIPGAADEACQTLAAFVTRACLVGALVPAAFLAIKLLRTCANITDVDERDRLAVIAFDCLDVTLAAGHFTDSVMEALSDATRALFARRVRDDTVLTGGEALLALRWIGRFVGLQQQRSATRFRQPDEVSAALWERWLLGHHLQDPATVLDALSEIQASAPKFLSEMPHLQPFADLLGGGASAVAVIPLEPGRFVFFVARAGAGLRGAVWTATNPPAPSIGDAPTRAELAALNRWTKSLVQRIRRKVDFNGDVIWCAKGAAAMASPWQVLPRDVTRIRCVASPAVAPAARRATRPRSTLIVYADPGPSTPGDFADPDLRGLRALVGAARAARTEVLAARGELHGERLPRFGGHLVQRAPSAEALITRQRQNDLIIIVAHGRLDGADAEIALVDDLGGATRITATQIAATPGLLSGASVVLLSCRTGVAGQRLHRPAGFAGACLAAGAVEVLAPLRAVTIDVAVELGRAVIREYCEGRRLSEALAEFMRPRRGGRGRDLAFASFVCWVG